jgi:hypothetical protein
MVLPYLKGFYNKVCGFLYCSLNICGISVCNYLVLNTEPRFFQTSVIQLRHLQDSCVIYVGEVHLPLFMFLLSLL